MTDKQIIDICSYCGAIECDTSKCKIFDLYKQKEEEYKTLENIAKKHLAETFVMQREIDQLKAENEDLKEIIQRHDNDNNALLSEFEDDLVEYYRRHRECLIEIKEIAEFYNNSNMDNICYQDGIYEILQKISEVIENE